MADYDSYSSGARWGLGDSDGDESDGEGDDEALMCNLGAVNAKIKRYMDSIPNMQKFDSACRRGDIGQMLINYIRMKLDSDQEHTLFIHYASCGFLAATKFIYSHALKINIRKYGEQIFMNCCQEESVEVCKWLFESLKVNVYAYEKVALLIACRYGCLDVAKWLFSLGGFDLHARNDEAIILATNYNAHKIVKWLATVTVFPDKLIDQLYINEDTLKIIFDKGYVPKTIDGDKSIYVSRMKPHYKTYLEHKQMVFDSCPFLIPDLCRDFYLYV